MLVAEIRLFANVAMPTYHVVVGDVLGTEKVAAALRKVGEITVEPVTWQGHLLSSRKLDAERFAVALLGNDMRRR